jgi:5-aminopentanamidase
MDNTVVVAIVQFSPVWNNKEANYNKLDTILSNLKADVIVLPELCTTGYSFITNQEVWAMADTADEAAPFFNACNHIFKDRTPLYYKL